MPSAMSQPTASMTSQHTLCCKCRSAEGHLQRVSPLRAVLPCWLAIQSRLINILVISVGHGRFHPCEMKPFYNFVTNESYTNLQIFYGIIPPRRDVIRHSSLGIRAPARIVDNGSILNMKPLATEVYGSLRCPILNLVEISAYVNHFKLRLRNLLALQPLVRDQTGVRVAHDGLAERLYTMVYRLTPSVDGTWSFPGSQFPSHLCAAIECI